MNEPEKPARLGAIGSIAIGVALGFALMVALGAANVARITRKPEQPTGMELLPKGASEWQPIASPDGSAPRRYWPGKNGRLLVSTERTPFGSFWSQGKWEATTELPPTFAHHPTVAGVSWRQLPDGTWLTAPSGTCAPVLEPAKTVLPEIPRCAREKFEYQLALRASETVRREPARALELTRRALAAEPDLTEAWRVRIRLQIDSGDLEGALADLARAIERRPRSGALHGDRAAVLGKKGDFEAARVAADRAVEVAPGESLAWTARATLRNEVGDLAGAAADFDRAIELDPSNPQAHVNRGVLRDQVGDVPGARADYDRAIALDGAIPIAWENRGLLRSAQDDHDGAIADLTRAIELDPTAAAAWSGRGIARSRAGDKKGALEDLDRAVELDARSGNIVANRANVRFDLQDLRGALEDYDRALALEPANAFALVNRGLARRQLGDRAGAIADLERGLAIGLPGARGDLARRALEELRRR